MNRHDAKVVESVVSDLHYVQGVVREIRTMCADGKSLQKSDLNLSRSIEQLRKLIEVEVDRPAVQECSHAQKKVHELGRGSECLDCGAVFA